MKRVSLIICCLCSLIASAQKTVSSEILIEGEIRDSITNETIPYATIKIVRDTTPEIIVRALLSDDNGKFRVKLPPATACLLDIQYVGKERKRIPIITQQGQPAVNLGKILLHDSNILAEVVVSAYRPLVQIDLDKIAYSVEDDPDARTNNVLEILKKVPLITVDGEDKIELKGSSSFKIYLDGKPSNLISNNPSQVLKSMPANMVRNIEIITDPGAKYDAEGVTGIINIITNKQPMGGYTGAVNASASQRGDYNAGAFITLKYNRVGFTGNYNYYRHLSPSSPSSSQRENYIDDRNRYLDYTGQFDIEGRGQYGSGELTYELDTLNLFSISYSNYNADSHSTGLSEVTMSDADRQPVYAYRTRSDSRQIYGGGDLNVHYQRTFDKKDELLTASYRYGFSPGDSESETAIDSIRNYPNLRQQQNTDAAMNEHTFQLDYTLPLPNAQIIEGGVKYIVRNNNSDNRHSTYDFSSETWQNDDRYDDQRQFRHRQDILSAYGGYSLKYRKAGFKAGLRLEQTSLHVEYPMAGNRNFTSGFFNPVPSTTVSYQLRPSQTFRLGYNMRIRRPGINDLNPYVNTTNPQYITSGNPGLEVEKVHNINANYNYYHPKFNLNATTYYRFVNNSIQQYTTMQHPDYPGVSYTTRANIGRTKEAGSYLYLNWNPIKLFRLYANLSLAYLDVRANNDLSLSNHGFRGSAFAGIQLDLPKNFSTGLNGGYSSPWINLQGKSNGYYYNSLSVNKNLLNNRLTISLRVSNPTHRYLKQSSEEHTAQFYSKHLTKIRVQYAELAVSFRFGELKQQIKKVRRGILDDNESDGDGNSNGNNPPR
jgi:outer membrane receptor protein involved in Fe transport